MSRPREYNAPVRIPWNDSIHYILKAIDNHTYSYIKTGDTWHEEQAKYLRGYLYRLKTWIVSQED